MGLKSLTKRVIKKIAEWAYADERNILTAEKYSTATPVRRGHVPERFEDANRGMNFTVYSATGGKVVQLYHYEPQTDKTTSRLYIVNDKDDLGTELGMIVTRECLTR